MAARIKDRMRDFKKMFKENWKLFKQSKLGLIGLGIIIFFLIIAILAPVIPYAADRDPVHWKCPIEDRVQPESIWTNSTGGHVMTVPSPFDPNKAYPIVAQPDGILSSGYGLKTMLESGKEPSSYLEVVYLSTGNVGKGIRDISPSDGTYTSLQGDTITMAIPPNFGPVYSTVSIYRDKTSTASSGAPIDAMVIATSTKGNVIGVSAHGDPPQGKGTNEALYTMHYTMKWMNNIGHEAIHSSASIFYGDYGSAKDDRIIVVGDRGTAVAYKLDGTQLWRTSLNGTGFYSPISVDAEKMVVFASKDGKVYGLNASTGNILWSDSFNVTFDSVYMSYYYRDNSDNDAVVFMGTDDGHIYGVRIYDKTTQNTENNTTGNGTRASNTTGSIIERAGKLVVDFKVPGVTHIGDMFITPDTPSTQEMYFGAYSNQSGKNISYVYSLRVSNLINNDSNIVKWRYKVEGTTIHARPAYDPKIRYVSLAFDDGDIYVFDQDGNLIIKETVKSGVPANTPLFATYIPEVRANVPAFLLATAKDGSMQLFSSTGKYLAPLPPGTYQSGLKYVLGTDSYGRDIFSQLIWGSRVALLVGFAASFLSVLIGVIVGIVAGYSGGWVDVVLMRFTDVVLVLPFLPLIIVLAAVMGPSIWNIILAITLVGWPGTARIIRSQVLSLKERPFIDAARVTGASNTRIMFRHIMPNVLPLAFLFMTFAVTGAILGEASLSFIGLGDPNTMSWGMMLYYVNHGYTLTAWWWMLPPGIAITLLVLGFFLVGRAFEEIINPRLRRRR
jgi:peptide/nickel transport system permease protein